MLTVPAILVRRTKGAPDALGNDTFTTAETTVPCVYAPGSAFEQVQGQDTMTETAIIYLDPSVEVSHIDAVIVDGRAWEVDGTPKLWRHALTGWMPGVEVMLRRAVG